MSEVKLFIQRSTTSKILEVYAEDSSGKPVTGITFGNVAVKYFYGGIAGAFAIETPALNSLGVDLWESGGWIEVDATDLKGVYQYSIPDAVLASAEKELVMIFEFVSASVLNKLYRITLTDLENILLGNGAGDSVIIEDQVNAVTTLTKAIQVILAITGANTEGVGTEDGIEFKPYGANQDAVGFRHKQQYDSNGDRSEAEYG